MTLIPGAEPFFYKGNEIGCLVLHGFTGSPSHVRWLGRYLHEQGYTVYAPLMAGHGTAPKHLAHCYWQDWYHSALSGFGLLRETCQQVFCIGLSMGGALSLMLAAAEKVDGVVGISVPHHPVGAWGRLLWAVYGLFGGMLVKPGPPPDKDPFTQWVKEQQKARGEPVVGRVSYHEQPAASVVQIENMLGEMRRRLPSITAPALLIHSRTDNVVPFSQMQMNYDQIGSTVKQTFVLDQGRHTLTEDPDYLKVFEATANFIYAQL